jgi:hypothetical protein
MPIRHLSIALAGMTAAAAFSGPVQASTSHFTIYNINGSASIQQAWIANTGHSEDAWTPVFLDAPIQPTGISRVTVRNANSCLFDIKVRFSNGTERWISNVDGCNGGAAAFN